MPALAAAAQEPIESVRSYLVTVVTRLCLDQLDSARAKRVTLRRTVVARARGRTTRWAAERADSLSLAFLVLLEELTPLERAAYLLHDVFGYSFDGGGRLAQTVRPRRAGSSVPAPAGTSTSGASASTPICGTAASSPTTSWSACATGDLSGLLSMLSDDVVVWTDGGGKVRAAMRPVVGPQRSSRFLLNVAKKAQGLPQAAVLNGQPASVLVKGGAVVAALVLDILDGTIVGVRVVSNPDKLSRLSAHLLGTAAAPTATTSPGGVSD